MNKEEIEIVYLSDDKTDNKKEEKKKFKLNFDFKKYKMHIIIGSVIAFLLIILITLFFVFRKEEITYQNIILDKEKIETTLDLQGIFQKDKSQNEEYKLNNLKKAVISGNKIYYSYSPNYCIYETTCKDLEKQKNECELTRNQTCKPNSKEEICKENYCEEKFKDQECINENNKESLCNTYYKEDSEYEDLISRYVLVSNLEGTSTVELRKHKENLPIEFAYTDSKLALYHSLNENSAYKIDYENDKITKIKDSYKVVPYPLSNETESVFIEEKENMYTLNYYEYNKYIKPIKQVNIYHDVTKSNNIRIDKYNKEDLYTISSSEYDSKINSTYNGIYKNSKLFYQFKNDYKDFFIGQNYIYVLTTNGYNIRLLKIDKKTGEETTPVVILKSNRKIEKIEYITTSSDNLTYLNIDNTVYTFNELEDELLKTNQSYSSIETYGVYNNFVYFYVKTRESNNYYDLVLYNIITKEEKTINSVEYFTINDNKLYTIENTGNLLELYKYGIY